MTKRVALPLLLLLLLPAVLLAQSPTVSGRWFATADFYGTPINFSLDLSQQGDKLTGDFGGDKLEGTLTSDALHFLAKDEHGGTEELTATVHSGAISGTIIFIDGDDKEHPATHQNILNNGYFVGEGCRITESDRICVPVPYYHCFGMVMGNLAATSHGSCIVLPSAAFEPKAVLEAVAAERCTALYGVPTMFIAELAQPDFDHFDLSSLRTGIMAGSPCPVEVMKQVVTRMHCAEMTICYGMTETSPVSTQTSPDDSIEHRTETVGHVHPHVEVKVIDPDSGLMIDRGEAGELCTRGYSVMLGYWDDPARTAEAVDAAGWMHTGDLAAM